MSWNPHYGFMHEGFLSTVQNACLIGKGHSRQAQD